MTATRQQNKNSSPAQAQSELCTVHVTCLEIVQIDLEPLIRVFAEQLVFNGMDSMNSAKLSWTGVKSAPNKSQLKTVQCLCEGFD